MLLVGRHSVPAVPSALQPARYKRAHRPPEAQHEQRVRYGSDTAESPLERIGVRSAGAGLDLHDTSIVVAQVRRDTPLVPRHLCQHLERRDHRSCAGAIGGEQAKPRAKAPQPGRAADHSEQPGALDRIISLNEVRAYLADRRVPGLSLIHI